MTDERIPPDIPGRIAVAVVWARKRRPLRMPLGILVLDQGRLELLDQEDTVQLYSPVSELAVSPDGRWRVRLQQGDDAVYVSGLAVQEARTARTRNLIDRHNARLVAPKPAALSDRQWQRTLSSRYLASMPTDVRSQKVVWQATLIALLATAGARATPPGPVGELGD